MPRAQRDRMRSVDEQLRTSRVRTPSGVSYVIESAIQLKSFWSDSKPAIAAALDSGVSTWVPTDGVAVMFTAPLGARFDSREAAEARLEVVQQAAARKMTASSHRIIAQSFSYPYRPNRAAPMPLLPIDEKWAAMLLTGEVVFKVELSVDRLVEALSQRGMLAEIALPDRDGELRPETPVLSWSRGADRGLVHAGAVEQLGIELNDVSSWADALSAARPPAAERRVGLYVCMAGEGDVWA